jgi:hypothetical protein
MYGFWWKHSIFKISKKNSKIKQKWGILWAFLHEWAEGSSRSLKLGNLVYHSISWNTYFSCFGKITIGFFCRSGEFLKIFDLEPLLTPLVWTAFRWFLSSNRWSHLCLLNCLALSLLPLDSAFSGRFSMSSQFQKLIPLRKDLNITLFPSFLSSQRLLRTVCLMADYAQMWSWTSRRFLYCSIFLRLLLAYMPWTVYS